MKQRVFSLVGISGVGKTTFLRLLRDRLEFQHLSASGLILEATRPSYSDRDALRFSDICRNQRLLIARYKNARDASAARVVLDSHTIIETPSGVEKISPSVFKSLGIEGLLHLSATPESIFKNRAEDPDRSRPQIGISKIFDLQATSLLAAREIAEALHIPFCNISSTDLALAESFIK